METTPCAGPPAAVKLVDPAPGCRISVCPWGLHGCGIPYARAPGDAEGSRFHDLAGVHVTTEPIQSTVILRTQRMLTRTHPTSGGPQPEPDVEIPLVRSWARNTIGSPNLCSGRCSSGVFTMPCDRRLGQFLHQTGKGIADGIWCLLT